jgi:hypothetical protein
MLLALITQNVMMRVMNCMQCFVLSHVLRSVLRSLHDERRLPHILITLLLGLLYMLILYAGHVTVVSEEEDMLR